MNRLQVWLSCAWVGSGGGARPICYSSECQVPPARQIATLDQLKQALGTSVDVTVFSKLKPLDYLTSYSHRGRYYTLREIARFDQKGPWSHSTIWFSQFGTLLSAAESFVLRSPCPCLARRCAGRAASTGSTTPGYPPDCFGFDLYTAIDRAVQQGQLLTRREGEAVPTVVDASVPEVSEEELKASISSCSTACWRSNSAAWLTSSNSILTPGRAPEIIDAIEMILEHDTAGDPITGLKWTRKTTEKIAEVLQQIDIPVSANTVSRLLYQTDFSPGVNRKQIAANSSPYRDQQFRHISALRARFQRQGLPSVGGKKRELIGNFKNAGAKWDRSPVRVNDPDFRSDASGVGIPYGIYDTPNDRGTVRVGVSRDTPAFAVHSIVTWWKREGSRRHDHAPKLLVLARDEMSWRFGLRPVGLADQRLGGPAFGNLGEQTMLDRVPFGRPIREVNFAATLSTSSYHEPPNSRLSEQTTALNQKSRSKSAVNLLRYPPKKVL